MRKTILYIGWVGYGNHGDDVCQEIFAGYVHKQLRSMQSVRYQGVVSKISAVY